MSEYLGKEPSWEREYWQDWEERLGIQTGTIYNARDYRNWLDQQSAIKNRQANVAIADGVHINGGTYMRHGVGHRRG